ncbi:cytochrome c biogenesis protein, transmembrane region [Thermogladius calderae 1633]|uniref:Cytochrome c biogenesis protein, transmembrane region n=1 Tax=Thermogladius calderae (strain DSM 22663 / VKM B-2946 / 1633) TaxID=1184251 RepID=I3TFZ9_THEC1|nr:cytochrome c biogenesis protein, region [Thermogladius calderae]AFK51687.1 cytochrome c biogenesis protein, transmembrane region [Thermogladius calderae 1633]
MRVLALALVFLVISVLALAYQAWSEAGRQIIIYGDPRCPHCRNTYAYLSSLFGSDVTFCDISSNSSCQRCYENIARDFYEGYEAVPITLFVVDNTISGVVMGEISNYTVNSPSILDPLLAPNNSTTVKAYVIFNKKLLEVSNVTGASQQALLEKYDVFYSHGSTGPMVSVAVSGVDYLALIPSLVFLSLLDSVNPCELVTFFSLATTSISGKRRSYGPPILFILLIYIGYFLLGLGLYHFARVVNPLPLALVALAIGVYNTLRPSTPSSLEKLKCGWCERLGINVSSSVSYLTAVLLAIISVTVLLPCTAGPYAVFAAILKSVAPMLAIALLLLYNLIFVLPLIVILVVVKSAVRQKRLAKWLSSNSSVLNFLTGLALVLISLYVILTSL